MRVLLIEDDDAVRRVEISTLRHLGHGLVAFGSAKEAFELLKQGEEKFDIVLSDNETDDEMTGLELLKELRSNPETEHLPFILTSGKLEYKGISLESACRELRAKFLHKPFRLDELRKLLGSH